MTKLNSNSTVTTLRTPALGTNVNSFTNVLMSEVGSIKRDLGGMKSDSSKYKADMHNILTKMNSDISAFFIQLQEVKPEKINDYISSKLNSGLVSLHDELIKKLDVLLEEHKLSPDIQASVVDTIRSEVETKIKDVLDDAVSSYISDKLKTFGSDMHFAYNELSSRLDNLQSKFEPTLDEFYKNVQNLENMVNYGINESISALKKGLDDAITDVESLKTYTADLSSSISVLDLVKEQVLKLSIELERLRSDYKSDLSSLVEGRLSVISDYIKKLSETFGDDPTYENLKAYIYEALKDYIDKSDVSLKNLSLLYSSLSEETMRLKADLVANYQELKPLITQVMEVIDKNYQEFKVYQSNVEQEFAYVKQEYRSLVKDGMNDDGALINEIVQAKTILEEQGVNLVSLLSDVSVLKIDSTTLFSNNESVLDSLNTISQRISNLEEFVKSNH